MQQYFFFLGQWSLTDLVKATKGDEKLNYSIKGIYQQKSIVLPKERERVNVKIDGWIIPGFITSQCGFRGKQKIHNLLVKRTVTISIKTPLALQHSLGNQHRSRTGLLRGPSLLPSDYKSCLESGE